MELERVRQLNDRINYLNERITLLKSKAYPGAIRYDDTGGSRLAPENKLEMILCRIDEENRRVDRLTDMYVALKKQAARVIFESDLEIEARHILYLRYLAKDKQSHSLDWRAVIYHVNMLHNIQKTKIYKLHHIGVQRIKSYNI